MFRFFRKLRSSSLSSKRIGKYLLYASGEIFLVVIGILIALAINNANQQRILREKEQVYLEGLQHEFRISHRKLQELMRVNRENMAGARELLAVLNDDGELPDEQAFSRLLFSTLAYDIDFNPNHSLLMEMINSGSLKDLENDSLRIQLTTWMATMDDINKQEDELRVQREMVVDLFRSDEYSMRTVMDLAGVSQGELSLSPRAVHASNLGVLQSPSFENNLLLYLLTSHLTHTEHYVPLLHDLEEILERIEGEIR